MADPAPWGNPYGYSAGPADEYDEEEEEVDNDRQGPLPDGGRTRVQDGPPASTRPLPPLRSAVLVQDWCAACPAPSMHRCDVHFAYLQG